MEAIAKWRKDEGEKSVGGGEGARIRWRKKVDDVEPGQVGESRKEQDEKRLASGFQRK